MGSLPNLHELERIRRKLENEREEARREQRAREQRESSCDRGGISGVRSGGDRLPFFLHPSHHQLPYNQQFLAYQSGTGSIGGGVGYNIGGTPGQIPKHHHRHSLTTRRVLRTRSSGGTYNIWDDPMVEHMAAYSPISSRAHRINVIPSYQVQAALAASRRRESINSSIGANSIRRLLTLNNRSCRHKIPPQVKAKIYKNFTFLAIAHGLLCAILIPLIGIQASNSIWHHKEKWIHVGPNIGSMLLSISFLISCGMCFLTTRLIKKIGYSVIIISNYIGMCIFLLSHLYPSIYTLIPAYVVLGITIGPAWIGKIALVVFYAGKLSCNHQECSLTNAVDALDEHRIICERDKKVRRLGRLFQAAQDIGIILGAIIATFILTCASSDADCFNFRNSIPSSSSLSSSILDVQTSTQNEFNFTTDATKLTAKEIFYVLPNVLPTDIVLIDDTYNHNEHGERICGADLCPIWQITIDQTINTTFYDSFIRESTGKGGTALIIIYMVLAFISLGLACLTGRIDTTFRNERIKGMTDTLLFAGPMAYFIGTEQAYMLGDFTRAFVSCSLGLQMVAGAIVGMGLMQSIVSCTLSMLLRHTKRIVVIAAGFFFHACLLLVLSRWKPSKDDSALFYVIAAAWGACNAMWETLLFALVTLTHTNHVTEVIAPLQALRFLGLGITFAAHGFLCENPKILILVIILVVSVPPYTMLEIRLESQRKAQLVTL